MTKKDSSIFKNCGGCGMEDGKGGENEGSGIYSFVNYNLWQDQDALLMLARGRVEGWSLTLV